MRSQRSYKNVADIEFGIPVSNSDEDLSKKKPINKIVRWKRYSRAFYLIGIFCCLSVLLYMGSIYMIDGIIGKSSKSSSIYKYESSYKLMIVADLDTQSRVKDDIKGKWRSILKKAELRRNDEGTFSIHWLEDQDIFSRLSEAGRGMELSALAVFNNHLYSFDDRTGIAFELIKGNKAIPRFILMEGDGDTCKGQKSEWATVKDGKMYVGSFGKEYTNPDGSIVNTNNMWVSIIDSNGAISHVNWTSNFDKLRKAVNVPYPGYMIHEAINWSPIRRQWVILPRRVSKDAYDEKEDEHRGSNIIILASEDFGKIEVKTITPLTLTRGFSEFKFLPNSNDNIIVALKSEENEESQTQDTYVTVFNLDGKILMDEIQIPGHHKFEGLEFFYFFIVSFRNKY